MILGLLLSPEHQKKERCLSDTVYIYVYKDRFTRRDVIDRLNIEIILCKGKVMSRKPLQCVLLTEYPEVKPFTNATHLKKVYEEHRLGNRRLA